MVNTKLNKFQPRRRQVSSTGDSRRKAGRPAKKSSGSKGSTLQGEYEYLRKYGTQIESTYHVRFKSNSRNKHLSKFGFTSKFGDMWYLVMFESFNETSRKLEYYTACCYVEPLMTGSHCEHIFHPAWLQQFNNFGHCEAVYRFYVGLLARDDRMWELDLESSFPLGLGKDGMYDDFFAEVANTVGYYRDGEPSSPHARYFEMFNATIGLYMLVQGKFDSKLAKSQRGVMNSSTSEWHRERRHLVSQLDLHSDNIREINPIVKELSQKIVGDYGKIKD